MKKLGFILFAALLLIGCREEVEAPTGLEISLCMPAGEFLTSRQRVMGDPGSTEHFELPRYAYIFVTKQVGQSYEIWQKMEVNLNDNKWKATRYSGSLSSTGDSIFVYDQPIQFLLNNDVPNGNIYAICSSFALTFNANLNTITTQDQVLNLKINVADDPADDTDGNIQQNLQNIYSTPYNYNIGNKYYCSYDCSQGKVVHVNMMLYHIAAKVDLKWNVADSVRIKAIPAQAVRLTYLEARRLYNTTAYAFRPMENELASLPTDGYNIQNIVTPTDEGLWWEGRTYFYTIPYTVSGDANHFPLQLLMRTNGDAGDGYRLTLNQYIDKTTPFVPWIRGNIVLTQPLGNAEESRTIGN